MNLFADSIVPFRRELRDAATAPALPGEQLTGIVFVFRLLRDGTYCAAAASDAFCTLYRVDRHVLRNNAQPVFDAVHPDDLDGFIATILGSARGMSPWQHEYRLRFDDGAEHVISGNALPSLTEQGNVVWNGFLVDITARRDFAARAEATARHSRLIMQMTTDGIHILDEEGFLVEANDAFGHMLGRDPGQMLGMHASDWNVEWESHALRESFADLVAARSQGAVVDTRFRRVDGRLIDVRIYATATLVGGRVHVYCSSRDLTDENRMHKELRIAAIAFQGHESMFITDAGKKVIRVNDAFLASTGFREEELIGMDPVAGRVGDQEIGERVWTEVHRTGTWRGELTLRRRSGEAYPVVFALSAVTDEHGKVTNYVGRETDITVRKAAEKEIERLVCFDPLTSLPNRRMLLERIAQSAVAPGRLGALYYIDLDNFKSLNDQYGHAVGDMLLCQAGERLLSVVRPIDTVARLAGDEFAVFVDGLAPAEAEATANALSVGRKILRVLNHPYVLDGHEIHSTSSIGIAWTRIDAIPAEKLMQQADLAMYHAKAEGRNAMRVFTPSMESPFCAQLALEADMLRGMHNDEFVLYFQPQLERETIVGAELLVRWKHPVKGLLTPAAFIKAAEQGDLIVSLGNWVLERACVQLVEWQAHPLTAPLSLSVNVSARQFRQGDFISDVSSVLARTGANPTRLTIELTESLLIDNVEETIDKMEALKKMGICCALDDFGVCYSSLSYLKNLPFTEMKIDQAFIQDVVTEPKNAAIVRAIITLGASLGLTVVAEGVETQDQRTFLSEHGCTRQQGYLLGRPVPLNEFCSALPWPDQITPSNFTCPAPEQLL